MSENAEIVTPWSSVGYLTYKRTYARRLNADSADSDTEEFVDTVERVIKATDDQLHCGFSDDEKSRLRKYMLQLKGTVAGRFLWQLGTSTVDKLGLASLMNCAFVVVDKPVEPFVWAFDMLMLGCFKEGTLIETDSGVKCIETITPNDKIKTYDEKTKTFHFVNPDWVGKTNSAKKQKVRVTFPDNSVIMCTGDHKFLTDVGWVEAQHLTDKHKIISCK